MKINGEKVNEESSKISSFDENEEKKEEINYSNTNLKKAPMLKMILGIVAFVVIIQRTVMHYI